MRIAYHAGYLGKVINNLSFMQNGCMEKNFLPHYRDEKKWGKIGGEKEYQSNYKSC